jgi:hypothetical protein
MPEPQSTPGIMQAAVSNAQGNGVPLKMLFKYPSVESAKPLTGAYPEKTLGVLIDGIGKHVDQTICQVVFRKLVGLGRSGH